jgi:hypothetical protein
MMFTRLNKNGLPAIALFASLLMGMDGAAPADDERRQLAEKQDQFARRIESLQKEQDFLLFQKSFFGSDSKYLVLDLAADTGTLKYRNRTLRTFALTIPPSLKRSLREGRYILTTKADGAPGKRSLVFQESFVIHGKGFSGASYGEKRLPGMVVRTKDLAALLYSVDKGTMLYIR